jgi:hypothetical protein
MHTRRLPPPERSLRARSRRSPRKRRPHGDAG